MNPLAQAVSGASGGMGELLSMMKMVQGKDPNAVMSMLAQRNPQFRQFMQSCQGKTVEQVAREYGVDLSQLRQFMK